MKRAAMISRQRAAAVVLATMGLVISSPLWHDQHDHLNGAATASHANGRNDLHVCDTGSHPSGPFGSCQICLSQRLLGHSQAETVYQLWSPDRGSSLLARQTLPAIITLALDAQARSPPVA